MIATIGASIAPGIALMSYFYLKDRYEVEPLHMVVRSFLFGILLVFPVMVIQYGIQEEFHPGTLVDAFFISGFLEEFFKWFVLYFTIYKHVEFDEPYDGIVYAVAISLGFATLENFLYLYSFGVQNAMLRAALPVSSHAMFGMAMGYYLGKGKFHGNRKTQYIFLACSMLIPAFLHGMYDYILLLSFSHYLWVLVPFLLLAWIVLLKRIDKIQEQSKSPSF